jgi:hypothetical protein
MGGLGGLDVGDLNDPYDTYARDLLGYRPGALVTRRSGLASACENRSSCRGETERERVGRLYRIAANTFVDHGGAALPSGARSGGCATICAR